ncbi:hypothetical protein JOD57_002453 [Geodermatophilus bullaregiensis]|nr:hypothetical protein [Geodermatophilus bullaregiensis]
MPAGPLFPTARSLAGDDGLHAATAMVATTATADLM